MKPVNKPAYKIPTYRARIVRDGAGIRCDKPALAADIIRSLCCQQNDREYFAVLP